MGVASMASRVASRTGRSRKSGMTSTAPAAVRAARLSSVAIAIRGSPSWLATLASQSASSKRTTVWKRQPAALVAAAMADSTIALRALASLAERSSCGRSKPAEDSLSSAEARKPPVANAISQPESALRCRTRSSAPEIGWQRSGLAARALCRCPTKIRSKVASSASSRTRPSRSASNSATRPESVISVKLFQS